MDHRSLECFVVLAEELHFGRAAERLFLAQPSLSQRIRGLEQEVGHALLSRTRRSVALTPAGEAFLKPARHALDAIRLAHEAAARASRGEVGRLRLGFTAIAFYGALPRAVRQFRSRYPEVAVELVEINSPEIERALAAGELDLGVLHPPISTAGLALKALPGDPYVLALAQSHPLASREVIPVRELVAEPLLTPPRRIGPAIYDHVIALFQAENVSPKIAQEVTPMPTLVGLVAAGAGVGFVTRGVAEAGRPGVAFRPVDPPAPVLPVAAAWREGALTRISANFLSIVAEQSEPPRSRLALP